MGGKLVLQSSQSSNVVVALGACTVRTGSGIAIMGGSLGVQVDTYAIASIEVSISADPRGHETMQERPLADTLTSFLGQVLSGDFAISSLDRSDGLAGPITLRLDGLSLELKNGDLLVNVGQTESLQTNYIAVSGVQGKAIVNGGPSLHSLQLFILRKI